MATPFTPIPGYPPLTGPDIQTFLGKVEALILRGFRGSMTLHCPGDSTIRSVEVHTMLIRQPKEHVPRGLENIEPDSKIV